MQNNPQASCDEMIMREMANLREEIEEITNDVVFLHGIKTQAERWHAKTFMKIRDWHERCKMNLVFKQDLVVEQEVIIAEMSAWLCDRENLPSEIDSDQIVDDLSKVVEEAAGLTDAQKKVICEAKEALVLRKSLCQVWIEKLSKKEWGER